MAEEDVSPKKKKKRKKSKDKADAKNEDGDDDEDIDMKKANGNANNSNNNNKKRKKNQKNMAPPNKMLFLSNLPKDASSEDMQRLFCGFNGFMGVNLIENKPGIGFAEFDDEYNSTTAQRSLNGIGIRGQNIVVEFAAAQ